MFRRKAKFSGGLRLPRTEVFELVLQLKRPTVSGAFLDSGQLVLLIVAVSPGFLQGTFGILGQVTFVVVRVGPDAVGHQPVARIGVVSAIGAVAVGVVGERVRAVAGELVGVVVGVGRE
jgi:hypothetical protein